MVGNDCRCPFSPMSCGGRAWSRNCTAGGGGGPRARSLQSCGSCRRPTSSLRGEYGHMLLLTCPAYRELERPLDRPCKVQGSPARLLLLPSGCPPKGHREDHWPSPASLHFPVSISIPQAPRVRDAGNLRKQGKPVCPLTLIVYRAGVC